MIFDKECEIDLGLDFDGSEFDVEYEPIAEFEYEHEHEYEYEHEQQKKNENEHEYEHEYEHECEQQQKKNEHEHEHEHEQQKENEHEHEHEHEYEHEGVDELLRVSGLAAGMDRRAERSDGETGTTSKVFAMIRSRSGTEAETPENPGGAGASLLVRSEGREAPQVAEREMKNPRAARAHALRSTGSDDPSGGDDV